MHWAKPKACWPPMKPQVVRVRSQDNLPGNTRRPCRSSRHRRRLHFQTSRMPAMPLICCRWTCLGLMLHRPRSEEHTSELQSPCNLVCRLLLEKKKYMTTVDLDEIAPGDHVEANDRAPFLAVASKTLSAFGIVDILCNCRLSGYERFRS